MPKNNIVKSEHIHYSTLYYLALLNLISKPLRSFLTVSGVVIGIGSISFLISFGLGLQQLVTKNVVGDKSIKAIEVISPNSRIIKLDNKSVNKIRTFPHISKVGVQYSFPASIGIKGGGIDTVIYGVDQIFQETTNLNLVEGRLLKKEDNRSVVVSKSALKSIGISDPKKAIRQSLKVIVPLNYSDIDAKDLKDNFKIVGVVDTGTNNEIFVVSSTFDVLGVSTYKQVKVVADDIKNIASIRKQVESNGFQTSSPIDTLDQINQLFNFFNLILAGFGGIGIIVAILGMFNTLTVSLLERTKEIGLMITLGGREKDMRRLFMIESTLLSLIGVFVGLSLSFIGTRIVNVIVNNNAASRVTESFEIFSMPLWLIVILTAFMVLVGLAVAYFPARRAQKINPIDALRRE